MSDSFQTTSRQGFGSRVANSLMGALVGGVMFIAAFPLLWWNEGRAIGEARALEEGAGVVVAVGALEIGSGNEGKLVHVSGRVDGTPTLSDADTGVSADALGLRRVVEMYQWVEKKESKEEKKLGGGSETVTTYSYELRWDDDAIDSREFQRSESHANPSDWPIRSNETRADQITLGAFTLDDRVRAQLGNYQDLEPARAVRYPESFGDFTRTRSGHLYRGANPEQPNIGDLRIRYEIDPEGEYSLVAAQRGSTLGAFTASNGRDILLVESGVIDAARMFEGAKTRNTLITWLIRAGGLFLMWIGLSMVFAPISRVLDILPMLGTIGSWGIGLISALVSFLLSLLTIAIAWVFYRPLLGGVMIAAVVGLFILARRRKPAVAAAMPPPPPRG